jgi:hypothetical protein
MDIGLWSAVMMFYGLGAIPTHLAMKHMKFEMPRWKRVLALCLWPAFINILMICDVVADGISEAK